jgi:hypothetical protein
MAAYSLSKLIEMHFMFILNDRIQSSTVPGEAKQVIVSIKPGSPIFQYGSN